MKGPKPSSSIPNFTGRVLDNGRYHIIRFLGSGAYGAVYRAVDLEASSSSDPSPHRAIKVLKKNGDSKSYTRLIEREIQTHSAVSDHPNIITFQRAFQDKDYVYLVLEFCHGGTLFNKICKDGIYWKDDALVKKVYLQILDAVFTCHKNHVFHRDLKPENILMNEDGTIPYLADFGLATDERFAKSFGCGSKLFMSPECIGTDRDFQPYSTSHSDIWSLGIILINMITARSPWAKAILSDVSYSEFLSNPDMLREQLPLSEGAAAIVISIFHPQSPTDRLTLTQLREEVEKLDTFFMSDEEIAVSGGCVRFVADSFASKAKWRAMEKTKPDISPCMVRTRFKNKKFMKAEGSQEVPNPPVYRPPPVIPHETTPPPSSAPPSDVAQVATNIPADVASSSSDESAGPITPETHAVEPAVVVSELEEGIGEPVEVPDAKAGPLVVVNLPEPVVE